MKASVLIGAIGLVLSVLLHELFHIVLHWGEIVSVKLFANPQSIIEVTSISTHTYNTDIEEFFAYAITLVTLLVTAIIICAIHDKKDTRSFSRTLLPRSSSMNDLTEAQLIELACKTGVFKY